MTPDELKALRESVKLSTRAMSKLAMLVDPTGWSRIERGIVAIDPARLVLVRARVALLLGHRDQALATITP